MAFRLRSLLTEINFDLDIDEVTIGRDPSCHLSLEDGLISNVHAVLRRRGDGIELRDANSRNGTRLNGRRISEPALLSHGDRIGVGTREVVFLNASEEVDGATSIRENTTAKFDTCAGCGSSCPSELDVCPRCGETGRLPKQTD